MPIHVEGHALNVTPACLPLSLGLVINLSLSEDVPSLSHTCLLGCLAYHIQPIFKVKVTNIDRTYASWYYHPVVFCFIETLHRQYVE